MNMLCNYLLVNILNDQLIFIGLQWLQLLVIDTKFCNSAVIDDPDEVKVFKIVDLV